MARQHAAWTCPLLLVKVFVDNHIYAIWHHYYDIHGDCVCRSMLPACTPMGCLGHALLGASHTCLCTKLERRHFD